MKRVLLIAIVMLLVAASGACGQVPRQLSFQGALRDGSGNLVPDDVYLLTFRIYNVEEGGTPLWAESQLDTVRNSAFSATLGLSQSLLLPFDIQYWLGVQLEPEPELSPRLPLTTAPYSFNVVDGSVVKSLNTLTDRISLVGGADISVAQAGSTITISHTGGSSNGGSLAYPDGVSNITPVTITVSSTQSYTVATGQNLYVTNLYRTQAGISLSVSGYPVVAESSSGGLALELPVVVGAGQVVSTATTSAMTISGFLVPATVAPLTVRINSNPYTVPAGKMLVITSIVGGVEYNPLEAKIDGIPVWSFPPGVLTEARFHQPIIVGSGQQVTAPTAYVNAAWMNGYLR